LVVLLAVNLAVLAVVLMRGGVIGNRASADTGRACRSRAGPVRPAAAPDPGRYRLPRSLGGRIAA
jgi:hypothetical protein